MCRACGAMIVGVMAPPPGKSSSSWVIVTVVVLVVVLLLVAIPFLYLMTSGLVGPPPPSVSRPHVILDQTGQGLGCAGSTCVARVVDVDQSVSLASYRVSVLQGTTAVITAEQLSTAPIAGGSLTFRFTDLGGEGRLTSGDTFQVSGVTSGETYRVAFLWTADGGETASITFNA